MAQAAPAVVPEAGLHAYGRFEDVLDLIRERRDVALLVEVEKHLKLVRYAPGRIEFEPTADAPRDLAARLSQRLQGWTGGRWGVSVVSSGGGLTVAEARVADRERDHAELRENPMIRAVFDAFPDARILEVRHLADLAANEALPEADDDWDPFEEG